MVLFKARDMEVKIGSSISVKSDSAFDNDFSSNTNFAAEARDISLSGAEADVEEVKFFGLTSGRQNAEMDEGEMTMREVSMTVKYVDDDIAELATAGATTFADTGSPNETWSRVQGDGLRTQKGILLQVEKTFGGTTFKVNIFMNNAWFTKMGDEEIDSEGWLSQKVSAKCLAKDYYEEFQTASA